MHENEHYFKEKIICDSFSNTNIFDDFKINIIQDENNDKVTYI